MLSNVITDIEVLSISSLWDMTFFIPFTSAFQSLSLLYYWYDCGLEVSTHVNIISSLSWISARVIFIFKISENINEEKWKVLINE